jgi:hypothetical protein
MNSEVEIHVGERAGVLAVPNAALRTQRDVGSAAEVLGLSAEAVQREVAEAAPQRGGAAAQARLGATDGGRGTDSARTRQRTGGPSAAGTGPVRARRPVDASFGGRYIVFVKRPEGPQPTWIRTGLTDLDYSEVVDGLEPTDSVLILPSASLVQSQQESQERINRITGGGGLPGMQQQQTTAPGGTRTQGGR